MCILSFLAIVAIPIGANYSGNNAYAAQNRATAAQCAQYHSPNKRSDKFKSMTPDGGVDLSDDGGDEGAAVPCVNGPDKWCTAIDDGMGTEIDNTITYTVVYYRLDCNKARKKVEADAKKLAAEQLDSAERAAGNQVSVAICGDSTAEGGTADSACKKRVDAAYGKCKTQYKGLISKDKGGTGEVSLDQSVLDNRCTCLAKDSDINSLLNEKGKDANDLGNACQASKDTIAQIADDIGKTQCEGKTVDDDGNKYNWTNGQCMTDVQAEETYKTCQVDEVKANGGIAGLLVGWIVCPFSNFASMMADSFYGFITDDLLEIPSDKIFSNDKALAAYHNILPFANIILAIMFVLVIYSEATGNGFGALSNYTVKKLLPRLVIFAILVNVSWYVCAAAIDVSNIIGANIKDFFEKGLNVNSSPSGDESHTSAHINPDFFADGWAISTVTFTTLMGAALAGHIVGMSMLSFLGFMVPLLIAVLVVLIVTWLILVIRQAGVIILCLISPLAIAVGMLPNGKQWTDKWLKAFGALWVTWPAVGLVLGCSTVAAKILEDTGNAQMIIAALAVRILPMGAIPFIVLASLRAFGKAGSLVQKFASGRMRATGRWNNEKMKQNASMVKDAAQARAIGRISENAMKWSDPNQRSKLGWGGKGKALAANIAMMGLAGKYERQASADAADQILKNKLGDNYEQKIKRASDAEKAGGKASWSDRQALRLRGNVNRAEIEKAAYEKLTEAQKEKQRTTDPHMVDMLNQKKAYEQQVNVLKNDQQQNYNQYLQDGIDIVKKYELRTPEHVDMAVKSGVLSPLQARQAKAAFLAVGAVPTMSSLPGVKNYNANTPEGQKEFSRVLGSALASSAGQLDKSQDAFKSARMMNLRQRYADPEQLRDAMRSGQMSKEDISAGVSLLSSGANDKDHPYGSASANTKMLVSLSTDVHFMDNVDSAKSVVNAMASNSEVKKSMPALSRAAADYAFKTDTAGNAVGSGGALDLQSATDKYGKDIVNGMKPSQVHDLSDDQIHAFASSKNPDIVQGAGDVMSRATQVDASNMKPTTRLQVDKAVKKAAESYTSSAQDAEWSSTKENVERLARSGVVHEFNPELSVQARVYDASSGKAVSSVDLASDKSFAKLASADDKERSKWSANEINVIADVVSRRKAMSSSGSVHALGDRGVVGNFVGSDLFYRGNKSQQAAWRSLESALK